jgi:hypothetical protein
MLLHGDGGVGTNSNFHIVDDIGDLRPLDIHIQTSSTGGTNPTISTAQSKFGASSFLSHDNNGHAEFLTPQWGSEITIELWFRPNNTSGTQYIAGQWGTTPQGGAAYLIFLSGSTLKCNVYSQSNTYILNSVTIGSGITANTWYHVAITWDGSTYRTFKNGILGATAASALKPQQNPYARSWIGTVAGTLDNFAGYVDEFRISNTARYTSAFTPSGSAFTNDGNTQVLLHFDGTNGSTTTTDDAS